MIAQRIYSAGSWLIWLFVFLISLLLFISSSLFCASLENNIGEQSFIYPTDIVLPVLSVAIIVVLIVLVARSKTCERYSKILTSDRVFNKHRAVILLMLTVFSFVWIISTQFIPTSDQVQVQVEAYHFHIGDYSACEPGGYLERYPHQLGLVWFTFFLGKVFGYNNYLFFQLINVVAYTGIFYFLSRYAERLNVGRLGQLCVLLCGFAFFPFVMMTSFVYGTLIGLCLSLWSVHLALCFFDDKKISLAVLSALTMTLAILFKSNYQVFLIALVVITMMQSLKEKRAVLLLLIAFCLVGVTLQGAAINGLTRASSGEKMDQGIGGWAYIAMGLHTEASDADPSSVSRASGWFDNWTVASYKEAGFDSEKQKEMAIEDIKESLRRFKDNPDVAAAFAKDKLVSQWCNPDFQCYWNIRMMDTRIDPPFWVKKVISDRWQERAIPYLKCFQIGIYLLTALALLMSRKSLRSDSGKLLLILIVVGGLVCHMFWEGKAQYAVVYYVLMFPYAILGTQCLVRKARKLLAERKVASSDSTS